jgi:hypothetical protein
MTEAATQKAVCNYVRLQFNKAIFWSDLSGIKLTPGQAKAIKSLKSSRGIPDFFSPMARRGYAGLFLEIKKTGTNLHKKDGSFASQHIQEQHQMLERLKEQGYFASFAIGLDDAINILNRYFDGKNGTLGTERN